MCPGGVLGDVVRLRSNPPAASAVIDYVAVVGQPVEERSGHRSLSEDRLRLSEGVVRRDDDDGLLVELDDQVEQQLVAGRGEGWPRSASAAAGLNRGLRARMFRITSFMRTPRARKSAQAASKPRSHSPTAAYITALFGLARVVRIRPPFQIVQ